MRRLGRILRANWTVALGAAVGALGGGLYAHFIGCRTGTCFLTGDVRIASLFFGITGAMIGLPGPKKRGRTGAAPEPGDGARQP